MTNQKSTDRASREETPRLELNCYVCGKGISAEFALTSERDRTDRPFPVHRDCTEELNPDVHVHYVHSSQAAAPQWVSVKDSLPDGKSDVLIFVLDDYEGNTNYITVDCPPFEWNEEVTHWQHLPAPPRGVTDQDRNWKP